MFKRKYRQSSYINYHFHSFLTIKFIVHCLNSLHQSFRILISNPFPKSSKLKLPLFLVQLQPVEVMREYLASILLLEDAIYEMAAKKPQFNLTSLKDFLCHCSMCLWEDVADNKTVGFFELGELNSFRLKIVSKFGNCTLLEPALHLKTQAFDMLLRLSSFFTTFLALLTIQSQLYFSNVVLKTYFLPITQKTNLLHFLKNFLDKGYLLSVENTPLLLPTLTLSWWTSSRDLFRLQENIFLKFLYSHALWWVDSEYSLKNISQSVKGFLAYRRIRFHFHAF